MSFNINNSIGTQFKTSEVTPSNPTKTNNSSSKLSSEADKSIQALPTTNGDIKIKSSSSSNKPEKSSTGIKASFKAYAMQQLSLGKYSTKQIKNRILEFKFDDHKNNNNLLKLKNDIDTDISQEGAYGGNLGNDYFNVYRDEIIMPGLITHFKDLQSLPEKKLNSAESLAIYSKLLTNLGQQRNTIAMNTLTPLAGLFGAELYGLQENVAPTGFSAWHEHLMDHLSLNELSKSDEFIKLEEGEKVKKLIEVLEKSPFLKDSVITTDSYWGFSFIYIKSKDITLAPYKIVVEGNKPLLFIVEHTNSEDSVALIANHFFKALSPKTTTEDDLKNSMALFYMHFNHTSVYLRGQAAISTWIMQALAESQGYKLSYDVQWGGGEKRPDQKKVVSPDMHALSYHDENAFVEAFKKHAILTPIEKKQDPKNKL